MEPIITPGPEASNHKQMPQRLFSIIAIVVVLIGAVGVYAVYYHLHKKEIEIARLNALVPKEIYQEVKDGDWNAVLAKREAVLQDPSAPLDQKAMVIVGTTRANFKISENVNDILTSIGELKKVFLDPNIAERTRILALNKLAFGYCASGRDPRAFAELYKDAPFSQYLVPNDPDASARNLADWSYSIEPSAFAAIRVARWYAQQYANDKTLSEQRREEYGATARKYLASAEALHEKEKLQYVTDYKDDPMYVEYFFWHARDIAWLAMHGDEQYTSLYKQAFEEAIQAALDQNSESSMNTLAFTRQYYARSLMKLDNDTATAKIQLDQLAKEMNALQKPLVSSFVRVIRNEHKNRPKNDTWTGIAANMKISSDFAAAVERVLAMPDPVNEAAAASELK